jgi:hypothetical protein
MRWHLQEADWAMFSDADGNEDGSISKSEFVKYCEGKGISEDDVETKFGTKPRPTSQVRKTPSWPRSWANFSLI